MNILEQLGTYRYDTILIPFLDILVLLPVIQMILLFSQGDKEFSSQIKSKLRCFEILDRCLEDVIVKSIHLIDKSQCSFRDYGAHISVKDFTVKNCLLEVWEQHLDFAARRLDSLLSS